MNFETNVKKGVLIIYLPDDFEKKILSNSLEQELTQLIKDNLDKKILLNLNKVKLVNSLGLGIIVRIVRELWEIERKLSICNINNIIHELLDIVNLRDIINTYETEEEAVKVLGT